MFVLEQSPAIFAAAGKIKYILREYHDVRARLENAVYAPLLGPLVETVHQSFGEGLSVLNWIATNVQGYIKRIESSVSQLKARAKVGEDILHQGTGGQAH